MKSVTNSYWVQRKKGDWDYFNWGQRLELVNCDLSLALKTLQESYKLIKNRCKKPLPFSLNKVGKDEYVAGGESVLFFLEQREGLEE